MKARNDNLLGRLQNLPPATATATGLLALALVAAADCYLPTGMRFTLLYVLGVAFIGWCAGWWPAFVGAFFAGALSLAVELRSVPLNQSLPVSIWNDSTRFLLFVATALLTAQAGSFARRLTELVEERTATLRQEAEGHKTTAAKLAETVERFQDVVNNISEVFWLSEFPDYRVVYISPGYEQVWGRKCEDVYHDPLAWLAVVHPADRERIRRQFRDDQPQGGYEAEYRVLRPDGAVRWIRDRAFPVRNPQGAVYRIAGVAEDITERKQTQEQLQTQAAILENMAEAVVVTDEQGLIVQMNPAAERIWGYPRAEVLGLPASLLSALPEPESAALMRELLATLKATGVWRGVFQNRRKDGALIFCEALISRLEVQGRVLLVGVEQDITQRRRDEQALHEAHDKLERRVQERTAQLREAQELLEARVLERTAALQAANAALAQSEERYRSLVNNLNVGVYRTTPGSPGRFLHVNPALARIHGFDSVEEFQHLGVVEVYQQPADRKPFLARLLRDGSLANYEVRLKKKDGTPIFGSVSAAAHRGPDGQIEWIDGVLEDITERKRAQEALRASEERYRALAESSPDSIFILDRDVRVAYVNPTAAALWQCAPHELIGRTQAELFPSETAQTHSEAVLAVFQSGQPLQREKPLSFPVGDQMIEIRLAPLYDAQGRVSGVMGICRDITERKRAEQQLAEALDMNQKMIAASTMGFAAYKASGECVVANEALARMVGGTSTQVRQANFRRLAIWRDSGLLRLADEALTLGQARSGEVFGTTSFGKNLAMDCHLAPFVGHGQPHLLLVAMDISERKRAEEALKMQSLILQHMAEGALLMAPDQSILFANSALEAMFGYDPGELVGQHVSVLNAWSRAETARFNSVVLPATTAGRVWRGEYENRRKDGSLFTCEARVIRLTLGGRDHFISVQEDITDRKRAESLLRAQRDVGVSLSLTSDMSVALKRFLDVAVQIGGLDCGGVYLLDPLRQELNLAAHRGLSAPFIRLAAHYAADAPQMKLVLQGQSLFCTFQDLPVPPDPTALSEGLRAIAVIPLSHNRQIIGALNLASHTADQIPVQTRIVVEAIAAQAAGAIARIGAEAHRHRLERQLLEISDREHARIGQDLHDGLCQDLVGLALDANSLHGQLAAQHLPEAKAARRIARYLDGAITQARQLARGLFPVRLEREGLTPALEELAAAVRQRFKVRCRFASRGAATVENSVVATHLYRIAQEAIRNALKHGRPRSIAIGLRARAGILELRVKDDGLGLPAASRKPAAGMGLDIMDYRARALGGTLRVGPGPQGGTEVFCCIPTRAASESGP